MKLQTRSVASKRPVRRRGQEQKSWKSKFCTLVYLLVVVLVIFGVANYRVDLNCKISELQRANNRAKQEIAELERDIQALKVNRDRLASWSNVRSKLAQHKMPFRAAESRQVRYFAVKSNAVRNVAMRDDQVDGSLAMNPRP